MKKTTVAVIAVSVALMVSVAPLIAHHAFSAEFDQSKPLTMTGKFIKMDWVNPHSWVHFEVTASDGKKQIWEAETPPPNQLTRSGWSRNLLQPGDVIRITGSAAKDGSTKMWSGGVTVLEQGGKKLDTPKAVWSFSANPEGPQGGFAPGR
jgi:hypothetical protein